jgi:hypothetical protein
MASQETLGSSVPGSAIMTLLKCRFAIHLCTYSVSYFPQNRFVIPTGAGAGATAQWRNLLFFAGGGKAGSSRQKKGDRNDKTFILS